MKTLGETIKYLRLSKRMGISDVASMSGVDKSYISLVERNERLPSDEILGKIAISVDVPFSFLSDIKADRPSTGEAKEVRELFGELNGVEEKLDNVIQRLRARRASESNKTT